MNWHYVENGQQRGPHTEEEFQSLVAAGTIRPDTLIWREGLPEWKTYASQFPSAAPAATLAGAGEAVCSECGRIFPADDVIRHGNSIVCAACKPIFLQKLKEGVAPTGNFRYAGFWIRVGAKLLDTIIIYVGFFVMMFLGGFIGALAKTPAIAGVMAILSLVLALGYQVFFVGKFGATPGKMILKLKIVTPEGGQVSYLRALGRMFAEALSGIILYVGYIMAGLDEEKRSLHDRICNTRVIYR